ncbi:MAG: exosortase, PEP-CTERM interaction domain protein [Sphingomonadaceae bacterium]|nr:exosortase, PEP-CTERM interaction domain protein [Sphingomonadaceae bacterium]
MPRPGMAMLALLLWLAGCAGEDDAAEEPPIAPSGSVVTATDYESLLLGDALEGPGGPSLDASLIAGENAVGDLSSEVRCPSVAGPCYPAGLPATAIYTYIYHVRPGIDDPNDAGLATPERVIPVERGESFALGFPAAGFTGVAGYAIDDAGAVLAEGFNATISCAGGRIVWTVPPDAGWSTGEAITFFWQSTQPPSGELGDYVFIADGAEARGRGPMPEPGGNPLPAVCG